MSAPDERASALPMVVGIGASAGGLTALRTFFARVPANSGLAYVVVVHLSPEHESRLADLLQPHAKMPVLQVTQTVELRRDHVYVIPPNANLSAVDTHLRLSRLEGGDRRPAPIDHFLRTLAATHDGHAVGVILTGTGSDGALGVKAIKEKNGLVIVQDPAQAEYDGMPRSAIATGLVDLVLPLEDISPALLRFAGTEPRVRVSPDGEGLEGADRHLLQNIYAQLRARTGRDFSRYKRSTVLRRIRRRMQLTHTEELADYLQRLRNDAMEVRDLADDLLITVTGFFRDPEVWGHLGHGVVPSLFRSGKSEEAIRAWSVGCATGEEAYSLAILLLEEAARQEVSPDIQIFASDVHEHSLERAREGFYPGDIEADVSAERLRRFFQKESGGYRVKKEVRERVLFAPHNLLGDPPFSRLDLISCRNVLIYLQADAQRDVLDLFHYALLPGGFLVLGASEAIDGSSELFRLHDKAHHVWRKRNVRVPETRMPIFAWGVGTANGRGIAQERRVAEEPIGYEALHRDLVERHAPPSILLGPDSRVLYVSRHAGGYLVVPAGEPTTSAFRLVREELRIELRAALHAARKTGGPVRSRPVPVRLGGAVTPVVLEVRPASEREYEGFFLVSFDERAPAGSDEEGQPASEEAADLRLGELQADLDLARQRLQAIVEEYEATQEEMRTSEEELQSSNEELRSTLEELETSKEELQSMNEELQTVNQENRHRVEELAQLSSDLQNLLSSTQIATLFLDRNFRILRFTPKVGELFNVRPVDRGRPLSDLTHSLGYDALESDAESVLRTLIPVQREVQDERGRWYLSRVLPYRSGEDRVEGIVLTFVDITERKRAEAALQASEERYRTLFHSIDEGFCIVEVLFADNGEAVDYRFLETNPAFVAQTGLGGAVGQRMRELEPDHDPFCCETYGRIARTGDPERFRQQAEPFGGRWFDMYAFRIGSPEERKVAILFNDVTEQVEAIEALRESEKTFRSLVQNSPFGVYVVDSDFRLQTVSAGSQKVFRNVRPLIGRDFAEVLQTIWAEPFASEVIARFRRTLETGEPYHAPHTTEYRQDSQETESYDWKIERIKLPDGRFGVVCHFYDLTDRQQYEEALQQAKQRAELASQAKSQFLAVMSHELRTPLTGVIGYADLLQTEVLGHVSDSQQDALARIKASSWHLVSIIDEILTLSRVEAGKEEIGLEEADVAQITREVEGILEAQADAKGLRLRLDGAYTPLPTLTDPRKVRQILLNLIGNGVKYTDRGEIVVRLDPSDPDWLQWSISDTGMGIAREDQERVFDAFTQVDSSLTRSGGGAGLGLAICRRLARLLGGDVTLVSNPGQGSTFTLRLPRIEPT